jgi:protein-tyrosine phosphatase
MVCLGNICRSPAAAVVLAARLAAAGLAADVQVASAGTGSWHVGDPADARMRAALQRHGHDGRAHRARQLDGAMLDTFDLILVMDRANERDVRRLARAAGHDADAHHNADPHHDRIRLLLEQSGRGGEVPDPYTGEAADFDHVVALVEDAAAQLVPALAALVEDARRG